MNDSNNWEELLLTISKRFNVLADFDFLLFLIGIQERGTGFIKYSKEEKMDMIDLARCILFERLGYYQKSPSDSDGWPNFDIIKPVDNMAPSQREQMLKNEMIAYFKENL